MTRDMKMRWIALLVENQVGVLAKVSGLLAGKSSDGRNDRARGCVPHDHLRVG